MSRFSSMCGRYVIVGSISDLVARFKAATVDIAPAEADGKTVELRSRYNVAPTTEVPVITERISDDGPQRVLEEMRWWLVPAWWKKPIKDLPTMFNARDDGIRAAILDGAKSTYKLPFVRRRCLVPMDGFYEWVNLKETPTAKAVKQPVFFGFKDGKTRAMAGLWEEWHAPEGYPLRSCTVITTTANEVVIQVHGRMPVILSPEDEDRWIGGREGDPVEMLSLLKPYPANLMTATPVSTRVNSVRNDDTGLIEPIVDSA